MHSKVGRLIAMQATRFFFIASLLVATSAFAQVVHMDLKACDGVHDTVWVVVDGNEETAFPILKDETVPCRWTGNDTTHRLTDGKPHYFSLRLGNGRSLCQQVSASPHPSSTWTVAFNSPGSERAFDFGISISDVKKRPIPFSYFRWAGPCKEFRAFPASPAAAPDQLPPFTDVQYKLETVILQLGQIRPNDKVAGLVLDRLTGGPDYDSREIVDAFKNQRARGKAAQAPSFSGAAIDNTVAWLGRLGLQQMTLSPKEN
jgi:hypothetical protein